MRTEYGFVGGSGFGEVKGTSGSIKVPVYMFKVGDSYSHIHPRPKKDSGIIGGPFSPTDIESFNMFDNIRMFRAVAQEGIYTIQKQTDYNKQAFINAYSDIVNEYGKEAQKAVNSGGNYVDVNNEMLIKMHNWLIENQKKYGYRYGLEMR